MESDDFESENFGERVRNLERAFLGMIIILLVVFSFASWFVSFYSKIIDSSLSLLFKTAVLNKPELPLITQITLTLGRTGVAAGFSIILPLVAFVFLMIKPKSFWAWGMAISVIFFLILQIAFMGVGMALPYQGLTKAFLG